MFAFVLVAPEALTSMWTRMYVFEVDGLPEHVANELFFLFIDCLRRAPS